MGTSESYDALLKICESRSSTRTFDLKPLSTAQIEQIRTVGLTSPYASGRKNWDIAVVTDREVLARMRQAVEDRVSALRNSIREDFKDQFAAYSSNFTFFASAPAVFVPVFRTAPALSLMVPGADQGIVQWERDNYVKSISCVAMLILLAAESLGLGGCYVTGALLAEQELAALIGLPPGRSIGALIPIGYRTGGAE